MTIAPLFHTTILALVSDPDDEKGEFAEAIREIWDFLYSGGIFMLALGLCSVFAITVVIYKAISLKRANVMPDETRRAVQTAADPNHPGGADALRTAVADDASPLGRVASVAASSKLKSREEALETVQSYARAEMVRLDGGIPALDVVITIAPLLGLLGTVAGLVGVFGALGGAANINDIDPIELASGIARALSTTIAGLAIAVPTVVAHSYFSKTIEKHAVEMEILIGALVNRLHPAAPGRQNLPLPASTGTLPPRTTPIGELADAVAAASTPAAPKQRPSLPNKPGPKA